MDDPWDSPWTTTDDPKNRTQQSAIASDPDPSRVFWSTSPPPAVPPALASNSPWADEDDGFGDWTSPLASQTQAPSGWEQYAGGANELASGSHFVPSAIDEGVGTANPIVWPNNIAASLGVKSTANKVAPFPQPSPGPWASEFPPDSSPNSVDLPPQSSTTDHAKHSSKEHLTADDVLSYHQERPAPAAAIGGMSKDRALAEETDGINPSGIDLENGSRAHNGDSTPKEIAEEDDAETTSDVQTSGVQSRRDSRCSDKSNLVHERQDSPITSIDEESKTRSRSAQRKEISKVQELVNMFDGLTRITTIEPLPHRDRDRSPLAGQPGNEDSEDADEAGFGDVGDVDEDQAERLSREYGKPSPDEQTPTPKIRKQHSPSRIGVVFSQEDASSMTLVGAVDDREPRHANLPSLHFDIPLENLDKLSRGDLIRDSKATVGGPDSGSIGIPDRIVSDSFSAISERKTWYRISRQGSSRKHNAGDDENYRRVAWPTSVVRDETITIVRRWMEVDSITGRATLGGGISKANIFGWDSKVEPVALDKVFRKKQVDHSRSVSADQANGPTSSNHLEQTVSLELRSPTQRPSSLALPVALNFGWSTVDARDGGPAAPILVRGFPGRPEHPDWAVKPAVPQSCQPLSSLQLPTSLPTVSTNIVHPQVVDIDEGDDEWGEMVTSPSNGVPTVSGETAIRQEVTTPICSPTVQPQALQAVDLSSSRNGTLARHIPSRSTRTVQPNANDRWISAGMSILDSANFTRSPLPASRTEQKLEPSFPTDKMQHSVKDLQALSSAATPLPVTRNAYNAHDSLALQIIRSLPDLSYMLR